MATDRVERKLAAILATDMVAYSRLIGADEEGTIARQKAHQAELIGMTGDDLTRPRHLGALELAIEPPAFIERSVFDDTMRRYLDALRTSPTVAGSRVTAPVDREWEEFERRRREGIPLDPETVKSVDELARLLGVAAPEMTTAGIVGNA